MHCLMPINTKHSHFVATCRFLVTGFQQTCRIEGAQGKFLAAIGNMVTAFLLSFRTDCTEHDHTLRTVFVSKVIVFFYGEDVEGF